MNAQSSPKDRTWRWELLIVGFLIAMATGLCTGNVIFDGFTRAQMDLPRSTVVTGAMIVGGIPFSIGIAMIIGATRRRREGPPAGPRDPREPKDV